jgi:hypothetical protein
MEQVTAVRAHRGVPAPEALPVLDVEDGSPVGSWPRPAWATRSTHDPSDWRIDHERPGKAVSVGIADRVMTPVLRVSDQPHQPDSAGGQMAVIRGEPVVDVVDSDPVDVIVICGLSLAEARRLALGVLELVDLAEREQRRGSVAA